MGDPEADVENEVLKNEQVVQVDFYVFPHFPANTPSTHKMLKCYLNIDVQKHKYPKRCTWP